MTRLSTFLALLLFFSNPAYAFTDDTGVFDGLELASTTEIPGPDGADLALCYTTRSLQFFGVPLSSAARGYALSADGCAATIERPFSADQMRAALSLGLVPDNLTAVPTTPLVRQALNYAFWLSISLALIAVIIRRLKSLLGKDLRAPMRKKAADRILKAMCHAGNCDGIVSSNEIVMIGDTAERLTRRDIKPTDVIHIADSIKSALSPQDFLDFGKGLRDSEIDDMMRAVFYVTLASGRLLPAEYEFLTDLAYGVGMPGEDFRRVINQALADLDTFPPN